MKSKLGWWLIPTVLLAAWCHAGEADKDVPWKAQAEIARRGSMVERVDGFQDASDPIAAISAAMQPPADDSGKWHITLVAMRNCQWCDKLRSDFENDPRLKAWVDTKDYTKSWAHWQVVQIEDQSQAWRWKDFKPTQFPTLIVQPPVNGSWGDSHTIVYVRQGYLQPAELDAAIRKNMQLYATKMYPRRLAFEAKQGTAPGDSAAAAAEATVAATAAGAFLKASFLGSGAVSWIHYQLSSNQNRPSGMNGRASSRRSADSSVSSSTGRVRTKSSARQARKRSVKYTRIIVTRYGGPEELRVVEEERPEPKRGEVRVKVLAAGVSLPDIMAREGVHPETPRVPYTPGWDLVGVVDRLGDGVSGIEPGQRVAALPIHGAYAEFVCLPPSELIPVPSGVDAAEAVSVILNGITAYQMLHRSAKVRPGQRVLIHGAAGGVGSILLQLGRVAGLQMYGTCSARSASAISDLGGIPIDYQHQDFVQEIHRLTGEGVDVVFDSIGGAHIWRSRKALCRGGRVVAYGLTGMLRGGRLASGHTGGRHPFRGIAIFAWYIVGGWLVPGRRRVVPYSIQTLKRLKPAWFRQDFIALFELLKEQKIKPLIAKRFPLIAAREAQEFLGKGGVTGKIVLVCNGSSLESGPAETIRNSVVWPENRPQP